MRIEQIPSMRLAYIRHVGPYQEVGPVWQRLVFWAIGRGLLQGPVKMVGLAYDDPAKTPPDQIRYDAAITVSESVQPEGEVAIQDFAGGTYLVATHRGPYEQLGETYQKLMGEWLPATERERGVGPCLEFYLNSPQNTRSADLLTDVYLPLKG
jgi:AraC family transcriptional regulator